MSGYGMTALSMIDGLLEPGVQLLEKPFFTGPHAAHQSATPARNRTFERFSFRHEYLLVGG
jgi:hypothetical protein